MTFITVLLVLIVIELVFIESGIKGNKSDKDD